SEGISGGAGSTLTIDDSTLHGGGGGDFVISNGGKLVHIAYTTISGSHCGLHFAPVDKYEIDHVTVSSNDWGAMLYGAGTWPNTIAYSNFKTNTTYNLETHTENGAFALTHTYLGSPGTNQYAAGSAPTISMTTGTENADAHPR